jgi:3-phenylpropionate/cinnamic acid dioxygenase small subunit
VTPSACRIELDSRVPAIVINQHATGAVFKFEARWCAHIERRHEVVGVSTERRRKRNSLLVDEIQGAADIIYRGDLEQEFTQRGEMGFMSETKASLRGRAIKFNSGRAWAEDPPSRTRHLITNIRVLDDNGEELRVASNFHLYRTRLKSEEDSWIGSRIDRLRRDRPGGPGGPETDTFRIAERTVYLEQTVLLSRNLSNFF